MATYEAISEVSISLKKLIWNNIQGTALGEQVGENGIAFNHPTDNDTSSNAKKLSIFLFRIGENCYQRNQPISFDNVDGCGYPIALDLYYMITSHFEKSLSDHMLMNQKLIGRVVQIFNENQVLRVPSLEDTLSGEDIKIFNYDMPLEEIGKIWGGLLENNPYMLSVFYEVTPVIIDSKKRVSARRATEVSAANDVKGGVGSNV